MRGKYSPTVSAAYAADQEWHQKHKDASESEYDRDGYDSYGYNKDDVDRAGNSEYEYYHDDVTSDCGWSGTNFKFDDAIVAWGFDGVKPIKVD